MPQMTPDQILQLASNPAAIQFLNALGALTSGQAQQKDNWTTTYDSLANPTVYGRNSFLSPCFAGDIFGMQAEAHGIINWIGWRVNQFWKKTVQLVSWWRGEGSDEGTTGAGSPCEDPLGWEWGECSFEMCHTSWYHRAGDPLGPHNTQDRCETSQRVRLNGTVITDDFEWQLNGIMQALLQDINWDVVHGSHLNAFEMNGLESIVRRGYADNNGTPCPLADSWLIDWGYDDLDGLVNGWGNFFDFLHELVLQVEQRAQPIGRIANTDMILFCQRYMADCILNAYACYSVCGVTTLNDSTDQAIRAQVNEYRRSLNSGPIYDGQSVVGTVRLKNGRALSIMVDDAFSISNVGNNNFCSDIYLLTRKIGNRDVLYGEYLDLRKYAAAMMKYAGQIASSISTDSAGRFSFRGKLDNWCGQAMAGISPEIYLSAPWAQARIMNVCCQRLFTPVVGTPFQPDYLPGGKPLYEAESWGMECSDTPVGSNISSPAEWDLVLRPPAWPADPIPA